MRERKLKADSRLLSQHRDIHELAPCSLAYIAAGSGTDVAWSERKRYEMARTLLQKELNHLSEEGEQKRKLKQNSNYSQ